MSKAKKEIFQPDDRFFGFVMSKEKNARAYIESFYPDIAAIADLDTIKRVPDDRVRSNLKLFRADIMYRCKFKNKKGGFCFSLIWEHKLKPEKEVAIQLGLYIMIALRDMVTTKGRKLEPVLPLVFYNGKEDWNPKVVHELFKELPEFQFFKQYIPNFGFLFLNVNKMEPEQLLELKAEFFRSAMLAMRFRFTVDLFIQYITVIFGYGSKDEVFSMVTYFTAISERSPQEFKEMIDNLEFSTKPLVMSTLQMFKEEGREEGKEIGKSFQSLKSLFGLMQVAPEFNQDNLAVVSGLSVEVIGEILNLVKKGNSAVLLTFTKKRFPSIEKLGEEDLKNLSTIVEEVCTQYKS